MQFFESPLPEVLTELQRQARAFDLTEPDPAKKGVNIIPYWSKERILRASRSLLTQCLWGK